MNICKPETNSLALWCTYDVNDVQDQGIRQTSEYLPWGCCEYKKNIRFRTRNKQNDVMNYK